MRVRLVVLAICLFVLLTSAAPGGKKDKKGKKPPKDRRPRPGGKHGGRPEPGRGEHGGRPEPGRGEHGSRPEPGRGEHGGRPKPGRGEHGGRPEPGHGEHGGRPEPGHGRPRPGGHNGRPEVPERRPGGWRDPRCDTLECPHGTRDSYVCGTDGETYESTCHILKDRCDGLISADVEVYSEGRCQHPAEAGEPHGHHGPGHHTPGHGKHPGGRTPHGMHPGGKTPGGHHHGHHSHHSHEHEHHGYPPHWWPRGRPSWWPEDCWDIFHDIFNRTETTDMPITVPDYVVDGELPKVPDYAVDGETPVGPACTATCPIDTLENPIQAVCGTNGKTYESSCILELVACVTDNYELTVEYEGECLERPIARIRDRFIL